MIKKQTWLKIVAVSFLVAGIGSALYYVVQPRADFTISDFNEQRDSADIHALMKDNWYWLIASDDFSVDYMLKNRAPNNRDSRYLGKLIIKVMHVSNPQSKDKKDEFAGFTAYYKKNFHTGQLLFVAVKDTFRGRGYGLELVHYAVRALAQMGVSRAQLLTRFDNTVAQSIYKRAGFTQWHQEPGFVYFEKYIK